LYPRENIKEEEDDGPVSPRNFDDLWKANGGKIE
jgi:hypothetical protein